MRRKWACVCLLLASACGGSTPTAPSVTPPPVATPPPAPPPSTDDPVTPPPPPPRLGITRILAFGDSLTEGRVALTATTLVTVAGSYPDLLGIALARRYTAQTIEVLNEGRAGEWAQDGVARFATVLRQHNPQLVILLEGINDVNALGRGGIGRAVGAIETMIKDARGRGTAVILAGYPPQTGTARSRPLLGDLNQQLRSAALDEQATFVDLFAIFGTDASLISADGLHPSAAGYERMAQAFYDVIRSGFETPTASLTSARR